MNGTSNHQLSSFQRLYYEYARFHYNKANVILHILLIPINIICLFKISRYYSLQFFPENNFNIGWVIPLSLAPIYIHADFIIGIISCLSQIITDHILRDEDLPNDKALVILLFSFICLNIFGHLILERRNPAIRSNLFSIFNSPFFIIAYLLYLILGYRKGEILQVNIIIEEEIHQYQEGKISL